MSTLPHHVYIDDVITRNHWSCVHCKERRNNMAYLCKYLKYIYKRGKSLLISMERLVTILYTTSSLAFKTCSNNVSFLCQVYNFYVLSFLVHINNYVMFQQLMTKNEDTSSVSNIKYRPWLKWNQNKSVL